MWLVNVLLLSLAPGCFTSKDEPKTEAAAPDPAKTRTQARKAKGGKAGARKGPGKRGPSFDPNLIYGVAGPVTVDVQLEERSANGKSRTSATLLLTAGDKTEKVQLGAAPGRCTVTDPVKLGEERTALWTAACELPKGKTYMSLSEQDGLLVVTRSVASSGKHEPVRKLKLAEGAQLSLKKAAEGNAAE